MQFQDFTIFKNHLPIEQEKKSATYMVCGFVLFFSSPVNVHTFLINWSFKFYSSISSDNLVGSDSKICTKYLHFSPVLLLTA